MPRYVDIEDFLDLFYVASIGQDKEFVKIVELVADDTPTADVVEVVNGKWISCKNNSGYKCSVCGARIKNSERFNGNHIWCHKCGAKMDLD